MSVCGTAVVGAAHCSELPLPVPCRNIFQKRSTMTGKNGFAKSGGSPRLFFSNSTLADNATYLAVCFGTTLFVVLNMAFALAFVEDLSRNANYFEDKNRGEGGNEKRGRHRRHRRDEEAEEEGRCRLHTSREYAFRNAACAELRAGDLRFLVARPCDRWLSRVPFAKKDPRDSHRSVRLQQLIHRTMYVGKEGYKEGSGRSRTALVLNASSLNLHL